jgi:hypothetical protein
MQISCFYLGETRDRLIGREHVERSGDHGNKRLQNKEKKALLFSSDFDHNNEEKTPQGSKPFDSDLSRRILLILCFSDTATEGCKTLFCFCGFSDEATGSLNPEHTNGF